MLKYSITTSIAIILTTTFIYTLITFQPEQLPNLDHVERIWNKNKYVEIENIIDPHQNIIISVEGCFKGSEKLFHWEQLRDISAGHIFIQIIINSDRIAGSKKQAITLRTHNLLVTSFELAEYIRLAYNDWIVSLNKEEHEKNLKELKDDGYLD